MVECVPCKEQGRPNVPALRFVPVNGKTIPMCDPCWGGGIGPGVKWAKGAKDEEPATQPPAKPKAADPWPPKLDPPGESPAPAKPKRPSLAERAKKAEQQGRSEEFTMKPSAKVILCGCGRPASHRGRCAARRKETGEPMAIYGHKPAKELILTMLEELRKEKSYLQEEIEKTIAGLKQDLTRVDRAIADLEKVSKM